LMKNTNNSLKIVNKNNFLKKSKRVGFGGTWIC
jgi:hypothetical protein